MLRIFHMIYNLTIAISRIYFAICEVRRSNSNPVEIYQNKFRISENLLKFQEEET